MQRAEDRVHRAEEQVQQERERVQRAEMRAQLAEERDHRDWETLERVVQQADARADDLQKRLDGVEGKEEERLKVQQQAISADQTSPSWIVSGDNLQLTEQVIGTGGWAEGRVAHLKVTAKHLQHQLVYDDSFSMKWQSLLESATPTCSVSMEPSLREG